VKALSRLAAKLFMARGSRNNPFILFSQRTGFFALGA
jgi:hypothetical protein